MLITERKAKKWFGDENPVGKTLVLNDDEAFEVEGVLADPPANSHIQFDYLLSWVSFPNASDPEFDKDFVSANTYSYFLFREKPNEEEFLQKIDPLFNDYFAKYFRIWNWEWTGKFLMQPLEEIHTTTGLHQDFAARQSADRLYALGLVGILILLMAWINYINLSTIKSVERSKEVGIRKASGAVKNQLVIQFLLETLLMSTMAMLFALFIVAITQEYFSRLSGWQSANELWEQPSFWMTILLTFLTGSLLAGLYPAFVLTAFRPVRALKQGYQNAAGGKNLRHLLSIVQYGSSVGLLIGTIVIYSQVKYLQEKELGIDLEQIFVVKVPDNGKKGDQDKHEAFRQKTLQIPGVNDFTSTARIPGLIAGAHARLYREGMPETSVGIDAVGGVELNFLDFYNIKMKAGRFFDPQNAADKRAFILSEKALKRLGYANPVDALGDILLIEPAFRPAGMSEEDSKGKVIGITEDVDMIAPNYRSHMDNSSGAHGFTITLGNDLNPDYYPQYYSLKVDMRNWQETEARIKAVFQEVYPDELYEYFFQDEFYNRQYQADIQFLNIFVFFAIQAIFIACLGLFGLAAFQVQKRSKEIGIRKVLGANIPDIWLLLARDLLKALLIASIIGIPLINYFMKSWLDEFVYKIPLSWWMFVLPVVLMILIALLTVSQHLRKAARLNPVKLLKYE
jgi:putative ABC transport system permease protein